MSNAFGPKSLAVLHHLAKHGDKNRLELERELGMAQLDQNLSHLRRGEHVRSLPKARGDHNKRPQRDRRARAAPGVAALPPAA